VTLSVSEVLQDARRCGASHGLAQPVGILDGKHRQARYPGTLLVGVGMNRQLADVAVPWCIDASVVRQLRSGLI
jgi:hypothetical protein